MQGTVEDRTVLTLVAIVDRYSIERKIQEPSKDTYLWMIGVFRKYLNRDSTTDDFTDDVVNRFLIWAETHYSQRSVAAFRTNLRMFWNYAYESHIVDRPPGRIRRESKPTPMPTAPTFEDIKLAIAACAKIEGVFMGLPACEFMEALLRAAWESGLRRGDMRRIRKSDIAADGSYQRRQNKTGGVKVIHFSRRLLDLLAKIPHETPFHTYDPSKVYEYLRTISAVSGVKITPHRIRRAGATDVFKTLGEAEARNYLGHAPGSQVWRHYVDQSQLPNQSVQPRTL
jgi:integrase